MSQATSEGPPYPAGFRTQQIATNGATLHVRIGGAGPAAMLLHGYGETGDMWARLAAELMRDHTVVAPDLPGYGYAKISREISQEWPKFIDPYIHQRSTLALCVVLVDANVPPQPPDRQLLDFLSTSGRDFLLVATKSDRLSNNQLTNALRTLTQEYPASRPLPYSAKTGAGRDELWKQIRQAAEPMVTPADSSNAF